MKARVRWISLLFFMFFSVEANAMVQQFGDAYSDEPWEVSTSKLRCEMSRYVPNFGEVWFSQRAGRKSFFGVSVVQPVANPKMASIVGVDAPWQRKGFKRVLATPTMNPAKVKLLVLDNSETRELIAALQSGKLLQLSFKPSASEKVQVLISPMGYRKAYQAFRICTANLLPFAFEDIRETNIYFDSNSFTISKQGMAKLLKIRQYLDAGASLNKLSVKGYTDGRGASGYNATLAASRAESVRNFLVEAGIPRQKIEAREYGQADPVASNRTAQGRALNRRVLIEMIQ